MAERAAVRLEHLQAGDVMGLDDMAQAVGVDIHAMTALLDMSSLRQIWLGERRVVVRSEFAAWAHDNAFRFRKRLPFDREGRAKPRPQALSAAHKAYGMTREDVQLLMFLQSGACAICDTKHGQLVIDHDHVTGDVRGLLCGPCNSALGHLENFDVERARAYRLGPPAKRHGIVGKGRVKRPPKRTDQD